MEKGWYGTYVPVVSVGPACVLMFGSTIPVAITAGILGGIIGPALAEYFCDKLPEDYHPNWRMLHLLEVYQQKFYSAKSRSYNTT